MASTAARAALVDFTDPRWKHAINGNSATLDYITLTATGGNLSFNGSRSERSGCAASRSGHGLACAGDGIGIGDDEITQGGAQFITVSFSRAVNVTNILLLDLFGNEKAPATTHRRSRHSSHRSGSGWGYGGKSKIGEKALINDLLFAASLNNDGYSGGFYATGFSAQNIFSIKLTGYNDHYSDYALAGIEVSPVPLPGAMILFGSTLLGLLGFRRLS